MKVGRGNKMTPEIINAILEALETGCTHKTAAACAGVSVAVIYHWLRNARSENATEEELDFAEKFAKAEAHASRKMQQYVMNAASDPENWMAAMTFLERREHRDYSLRHKAILSDQIQRLSTAQTYTEKTQIIRDLLAASEITPEEGKHLAEIIAIEAKVEEITELRDRVAKLEEMRENANG